MKRILFGAILVASIVSSTIIKSPPGCTTAVLEQPLTLPCATDLKNPVSWRHKSPEIDHAKYIFVFGTLKPYAGTLGVSRVDKEAPGRYNLVFDRVRRESASQYQCQDNDGMGHGPVVEVIVLKAPMFCSVSEVQDDSNVTVAWNLTCSLQYRLNSNADSFIWYSGNKAVESVNTLSADDQWNTVVSTCMVNHAQFSNYTFVANFRGNTGEGKCAESWSYLVDSTSYAMLGGYDRVSNSHVGFSFYSITFLVILVVACVLFIVCVVLIALCVRSNFRTVKDGSKMTGLNTSLEISEAYTNLSNESESSDGIYCTIESETDENEANVDTFGATTKFNHLYYESLKNVWNANGHYEKAKPLESLIHKISASDS